ncbi:aminoglycoside phosphotransferase [Sphingomonas oleivorans]|uniref:Aminoglycoside phosphotransferase n=1 Tax=Sphingomonas oleivorans TaxID=1735121 RepID=A0A2T5FYI0_9SPHN|nr:AAA family ATPase [Sphingomonas oleivorans]PTQ11590.1 aminoglycoside phosphotransferase [Sphingomonas oleivorans]
MEDRRQAASGRNPPEQEETIAFLEGGQAFPEGPPVRIDTHAAIVFLAGDRAWKLKRAVRFEYLDFSTPERRHAALEAELRLNRRTAPLLYQTVMPIARDGQGALAIGGTGVPIDWLLRMRRLPEEALFVRLAERGRLDAALLTRLADRLVAFHGAAEVVRPAEPAAGLRAVIEANRRSMERYPDLLDPAAVAALAARSMDALMVATPLIGARAEAGRVRRGHGDLHLGNIAMIEGEPTPFDCLEFDEALATIDILYDLAFLLMDLWQREQRDGAAILFNRYLDLSPEDEDGLALMPLFLSLRAAVRAHVEAATARGGQAGAAARASSYLAAAAAFLDCVPPRLLAIGGLSGTGKSTLARALAAMLGRPPGARILRSDVVRKRMHGLPPERRLPPDAYGAAESRQVYARLAAAAGEALGAGSAVIADAVFGRPDERDAIRAVAEGAGAPFFGLWLRAGRQARIARVSKRGPDASDADAAVVAAQSRLEEEIPPDWHVVQADGTPDMIAAEARKWLRSGEAPIGPA